MCALPGRDAADLRSALQDHRQIRPMADDLAMLEDLCDLVKNTSLCGLGQSSPNPVLTIEAREHYRIRKKDLGRVVMIGRHGQSDPQKKGKKGYAAYVSTTGKIRLLKSGYKEQPYKARRLREIELPLQRNLHKRIAAFKLATVGAGRIRREKRRRRGRGKPESQTIQVNGFKRGRVWRFQVKRTWQRAGGSKVRRGARFQSQSRKENCGALAHGDTVATRAADVQYQGDHRLNRQGRVGGHEQRRRHRQRHRREVSERIVGQLRV